MYPHSNVIMQYLYNRVVTFIVFAAGFQEGFSACIPWAIAKHPLYVAITRTTLKSDYLYAFIRDDDVGDDDDVLRYNCFWCFFVPVYDINQIALRCISRFTVVLNVSARFDRFVVLGIDAVLKPFYLTCSCTVMPLNSLPCKFPLCAHVPGL